MTVQMAETCPALTELSGPLSADVRRHVAECLRCKALVRHLDAGDGPVATAEPDARPVELRRPPEVAAGDVCAVRMPGLHERLLCAVLGEDAGVVEVVPVGDEPRFATDRDLLLDADVLGYESMAEAWQTGEVLTDDVDEVLGRLDDKAYDLLVDLVDAVEDAAETSPDAPTGPPVTSDDDVRHDFQQHETQRARPFFASAAALRGVDRVAALLTRASEEEGVSRSQLSRRYGPMVESHPGWVDDLFAERIDVREIPGRTLGALFAEFSFRPTQRLGWIVRSTGWPDEQPAGRSHMALITRAGGRIENLTEDEPDRYLAEFYEGLAESLSARAPTAD
jgi:hypothetical protein